MIEFVGVFIGFLGLFALALWERRAERRRAAAYRLKMVCRRMAALGAQKRASGQLNLALGAAAQAAVKAFQDFDRTMQRVGRSLDR